MAKRITLKDANGTDYVLEFNRKTVESMERNGFVLDTDRPNSMIDQLFRGAFQMHHKGIDQNRIREIWKQQRQKDELLTALVQIYMEPLENLMADPEGDSDDENPSTPTWKMI